MRCASGRRAGRSCGASRAVIRGQKTRRPIPALSRNCSCLVTKSNKTAPLFTSIPYHSKTRSNNHPQIVGRTCEEPSTGPVLLRLLLLLLVTATIRLRTLSVFDTAFVLVSIEVSSIYAGTLATGWTTARQQSTALIGIKSPRALFAASLLSLVTFIIAACLYVSGHDTYPIVQFTTSTPNLISLIAADNSNSQSHSSKVLVLRVPDIIIKRNAVQSDIRIIQANSKASLFNDNNNSGNDKIASINIKWNDTTASNRTRTGNKSDRETTRRRKRDFSNKHSYLVNNQIPVADSKSYSSPKTTVASSTDGARDTSEGAVLLINSNNSVSDGNVVRNYPVYTQEVEEESRARSATKRPMPSAHDHNHNSCKFPFYCVI